MDANQMRRFVLGLCNLRKATGIDTEDKRQSAIKSLINRLTPPEDREACNHPSKGFSEKDLNLETLHAALALQLVRDVLARCGLAISNIYELVDEMKRLSKDQAAIKELREFCGLSLELLGESMLISIGSDEIMAKWIFQPRD